MKQWMASVTRGRSPAGAGRRGRLSSGEGFQAERNQERHGFARFAQSVDDWRNGLDQLEKAFAGIESPDGKQQVIGGEAKLTLKIGFVQAQMERFDVHAPRNDPDLLVARAVASGQRISLGPAERDDGIGRVQDFFLGAYAKLIAELGAVGGIRYGPASGVPGVTGEQQRFAEARLTMSALARRPVVPVDDIGMPKPVIAGQDAFANSAR